MNSDGLQFASLKPASPFSRIDLGGAPLLPVNGTLSVVLASFPIEGGDGPELTLNGHISTETEPFLGDHLEKPAGAEVHLAVERHGTVDPDALPEQINTPAGTSDHRWFAVFD